MTNNECYEYLKSILREMTNKDLEYYLFLKTKRNLNRASSESVDRDIAKSVESSKSCEDFLDRALILVEGSSK